MFRELIDNIVSTLLNILSKLQFEHFIDLICALIGATVSILGVYLTIKYARKQFRDEKRMQIRPYLNFFIKSNAVEKNFSEIILERTKKIFNGTMYIEDIRSDINTKMLMDISLKIENLGLGHAINCKITDVKSNKRSLYVRNKSSLGNIKNNEKEFTKLDFTLELMDIDILGENINFNVLDLNNLDKLEKLVHDKFSEEILITIEYEDILYNKYSYILCINIGVFLKELVSLSYKVQSEILYEKCEEKVKISQKVKKLL